MATTTKQLDSWAVLRDILQREGVARQHLNSYNEFIAKGLQSIIDEIAETLLGLRSKGELTMILVEQNLDFIATLSERVLIIQKGAIVHSAEPDELHGHGLINEFIGVSD